MRAAGRLAHRVIKGQAFVVDPMARRLHTFNAVGTRLWELAAAGAGPDAAAAAVAGEFDVDLATARADAAGFLARLRSMGLLEDGE